MRISIVIATKDRASYLEHALASFEEQTGAPPFEVIVVDNGSTDETKSVVERQAARGVYPVAYVYEGEPNRGKARNCGIERASGYLVLFCDDDVVAPPGYLAAHDAAHTTSNFVVNGPILNVPSYEERPAPTFANYSRAFLCTCNVSIPKHSLVAVGAFDEAFHLYGWEDTELGVRLREAGMRWKFAWDAYIWHIKPPDENTLEVETRKAMEKARMARKFLDKQPSRRVRMATGAHRMNLIRARWLFPDPLLAIYAGIATSENAPRVVRALARARFLDGMYHARVGADAQRVTDRALLYCAGGGIGDSLVASVVARALHSRYARVDALTLPAHRSTLERVPDVNDVLIDEGGDETALAHLLHERGYDACVITWATPRTARVAKLARIPIRVGQARRLYSGRFTKRVVVRSERGDVTSPWADILLDYARAIGCDTDDIRPRFVPTANDIAHADELRVSLTLLKDTYIILHPTNAIATKRGIWPAEGWAALSRALQRMFRVPILLSGSNADLRINEAIRASNAAPVEGSLLNIAGRLGIGAFGALAQHARAFVGITTGAMHVAAAVGAPTVGIFPFQSDFPDRWAPLGPRTATVRPTFRCHPGDTKEHCRDYACIAHLDVARIAAAVEELIA